MAITGMRSNEVREYIPRDDPCRSKEDGATVFYHRPVPNKITTRISDQQASASMEIGTATQTMKQHVALRNRECFRFGVTGWDNLFEEPADGSDKNGDPIPFETTVIMEGGASYTVVSDETMDRLFGNTIQEVGNEIWNRNNLSESQRKKFEASLSLFGGSGISNVTTAPKTNDANEDASDPQSEQDDNQDGLPPGGAVMR